jgi:large subunit ribosomal protein L21
MSFAIIKTGGKQYKVSEGDKLLIEKLEQEVGKEFSFDEVLMVGNSDPKNAKIGTPLVEGASVTARVIEQGKGEKKIVFKYSNKTRYKKKKGHRQPFSEVEILKINSDSNK